MNGPLGTANTPAEIYANVRNKALEEAANCFFFMPPDAVYTKDQVANAIRALKTEGK